MSWKDHRCPFCSQQLAPAPNFLTKVGPATYTYLPCECPVQFTAHGYPRKPR